MVSFTVNGTPVSITGKDDKPLLWALREDLGLLGTKYGCGVAQCGACTVLVDGEALRSCAFPVEALQGKQITTIEGLPEDHPLKAAWTKHDVPQCGYCQSGQIMSAAALLRAVPKPTDTDIDLAMSGNICRCGTYQRIRAAIKSAANSESDG
jgi:isoquinoline 1-oxidoreductase alpha subunit